MASSSVEQEILQELARLSAEEQGRVLELARTLARRGARGVRGGDLLQFAGAIAPDDLSAMTKAIEDGCESVMPDE